MFLSNPIQYLLVVCFLSIGLQACGAAPGNADRPVDLNVAAKSEFPFSTREPEVYQAELVVESGPFSDKWFVARNKEKRRIDFFENGGLSRTQINSDAVYQIDHGRMIYCVSAVDSDPVNDLTDKFFKGKEYRKFVETSRDGSLVRYKVTDSDGKGEVQISVDEKSGVMMRQEFVAAGTDSAPFVYEVRDLRFEVPDSTFAIPDGFRKVSGDDYRSSKKIIK